MSGLKQADVIDTVRDSEKQKLRPPRKYQVILNNDDFTPMDFVIEILMKFFNKNSEQAAEIMLKVHYDGKAICGIYSADIAQSKVEQVNKYARENQHPLLCRCEQV
ncbi:ATP-dependent Clp protease adapter ClpS [Pseudoalteromonas denitrificans]|uniref:ATP-dependent Clp protease adapter protein ClpS n=1 Tax=Pseudoalteromonas denitrificans DSM 6059 TaxID=1123010 RepID=A0A1I1S230_9GAMM|nr:ATP-dependent Clp protease adapter ClpS [Pseudoalteromonas denitrificans]SFD38598.1 ATP-dependent Clp protease adaptor protein ClpS [Pseudoalteromonas denitrificans DSM 6059]